MRAIANVLESSDYDIIGLQELWVLDDYEHIQSKLLKSLPYSKYFYRRVLYRSREFATLNQQILAQWRAGIRSSYFLQVPYTDCFCTALLVEWLSFGCHQWRLVCWQGSRFCSC